MTRQTAVLSWLVRQPSVSFQFLGISPVYVEITQHRILYRSVKEFCYWSSSPVATSSLYYSYGLFGSDGYSKVGPGPGYRGYAVNVGSTYFSYRDSVAHLMFRGRHAVDISIYPSHLIAYITNGPIEIKKKLKHPSLPMRDTLEDAQAVLTYLLKLKDQMIELGY